MQIVLKMSIWTSFKSERFCVEHIYRIFKKNIDVRMGQTSHTMLGKSQRDVTVETGQGGTESFVKRGNNIALLWP